MSGKKQKADAGIPERIRKLAGSIRGRMPPIDGKRLIMLNIPYVIVFYLADRVAWLYRHCVGGSLVERLGVLFLNFQLAFSDVLPSIHAYDLTAGVIGVSLSMMREASFPVCNGMLPDPVAMIAFSNSTSWHFPSFSTTAL